MNRKKKPMCHWWSLPSRWAWIVLVFLGGTPGQAAETKINVYASIPPHAYFVERIGGSHVNVLVMIGPGQNHETYEPAPRQMVQLSKSRLYFQAGLPFEDVWLRRIQSLNPQLRVVDLREGITLRPLAGHAQEAEAAPEPRAKNGELKDPHIWLNPMFAQIQARAIAQALEAGDPAHAAEYRNNLEPLLTDLRALHEEITKLLTGPRTTKFIVYHPAWGYFADAYGLEQISVEVEGKEPSAQQLAELIETAKANQIKTVFIEPRISQKSAETLAQEIGGKVAVLDPLGKEYMENLKKAAQTIAEALR
ncbi:MAG: metal ABC transporter solute-binding protein, Zn/Mn family [bacterium]